ncbi:MAG: hypothetical protein K2N74_02785 [Clostridiales bacterium]|nr:hypothetical protein [Clostridiales bacterium]
MSTSTFKFQFQNITRELPVHEVGAGTKIAYLDTLSDYELVAALSQEIAKILCANKAFLSAERVTLFTAENKGVPFAYAVARALKDCGCDKGIDLAIARKRQKMFFGSCISTVKLSITSEAEDKLFVPEYDVKKLKNAAVVLLDDFYSTGASINALEDLANQCGANIIDKVVAVWEVSNENKKPPVKYVTTLPLL